MRSLRALSLAAGLILFFLAVAIQADEKGKGGKGKPGTKPPKKKPDDKKTDEDKKSETPPAGEERTDGSLSADVLNRVKSATCYLRVTTETGLGMGSGFFAVDKGIVLTNAHVIGMLRADSPHPKTIEVILNSGLPNERKLPGKVLTVDRSSDLAVVQITHKDLPDPLTVYSAKDLRETQKVFVCGFPFGETLGKEISIRPSSVASLRMDKGELSKLQLEGGMNPGNSGGPVVDARGHVIGVSVAIWAEANQIAFAIPGDHVQSLLNGRVASVSFGQSFRDGKKIKVPATMQLLDPLAKVKKASIEVWTGDPGDVRPPSTSTPKGKPSDSTRQPAVLTCKDGMATGDVVLPDLPSGKVYWFQPVVTNAKQSQWASASPLKVDPPIDKKPVTLSHSQKSGTRGLEVTNSFSTRPKAGADAACDVVSALNAQMSEQVKSVDGKGTASVQLKYTRCSTKRSIDGRTLPSSSDEQAGKSAGDMTTEFQLDKKGAVLQGKTILKATVPGEARAKLTDISDQVRASLASFTIAPTDKLTPGQSWTGTAPLPVDSSSKTKAASATLDIKYTYLGVRSRNGRQEAVISLAGTARSQQGSAVSGKVTGAAAIDVATGVLASGSSTVDIDIDLAVLRIEGRTIKITTSSTIDTKVERTIK